MKSSYFAEDDAVLQDVDEVVGVDVEVRVEALEPLGQILLHGDQILLARLERPERTRLKRHHLPAPVASTAATRARPSAARLSAAGARPSAAGARLCGAGARLCGAGARPSAAGARPSAAGARLCGAGARAGLSGAVAADAAGVTFHFLRWLHLLSASFAAAAAAAPPPPPLHQTPNLEQQQQLN